MSATPEKPTGGLPQCPGFLRENLKAFLDGELSPLRRGMMRWHLTRCAHCREESVWLSRLGEDMRTLEKSAPRPELRKRILASLPPPVPMRPPVKIWRPERAVFRYAPNLALGAAVSAFALGGSFAALSRVPRNNPKPAVVALVPAPLPQEPTADNAVKTNAVKQTAIDPFATVAKTDDPTSRKANAYSRETARRLAMQRRQEARLASGKPDIKIADAAPPLLTLTPNVDAADVPRLRQRLEALAIQAGGEMKPVPLAMAHLQTQTVAPSVPLESRTGVRPVNPAPSAASEAGTETDAAQFALRIPSGQLKPFLQAAQTLGTLKRSPPQPNRKSAASAVPKVSEKNLDQSATRDMPPACPGRFRRVPHPYFAREIGVRKRHSTLGRAYKIPEWGACG